MNEQKIEEIKNAIREMIQIIIDEGRPLSDEMKLNIAKVMEHAATRIQTLRNEEAQQPQPQPEPEPEQPQGRQPFQGQTSPTINEAPPSPDAQLLWILAGQQEEAFLQYLQQFPTPSTQALLNNPTELERVIEHLHAMMPPGEQPIVDGIQHADLNSSTIWGTAYNPGTGKMKVRFQGGSEYEYDNIPPNIYRAFSNGQASAKTNGSNEYGAWWKDKNPSMGAALNQYIKAGNFSYRKIA